MQTEIGKNCSVRILSRTDGKKSFFSSAGNCTKNDTSCALVYRQENSIVRIEAQENVVRMSREGDLYLNLCFLSGKLTEGEIGLDANAKGTVSVYTRSVQISYDKGVKIVLDYTLRFSESETQNVFLQLIAE